MTLNLKNLRNLKRQQKNYLFNLSEFYFVILKFYYSVITILIIPIMKILNIKDLNMTINLGKIIVNARNTKLSKMMLIQLY